MALFLPGITAVPPTDRDEARFMQATKQMLETGDLVNIRFQDEPRTKKPVGIHWLQYASVKVFAGRPANDAWMYRAPSALASWLAVMCVFLFGRRLFNNRAGLIAASLTACTLLTIAEAHLAKTDAALLLTVVLAHMGLAQFYLAPPVSKTHTTAFLLLWGGIGAGLLIKGPVIAAMVVATIVALSAADKNVKWLRRTRPMFGLLLSVGFILPWAVMASANGDGNVILTSLSEDFLPKLIGGSEGHGAYPGTHLLLSPITLWPASLIILPGLVLAWRERHTPAIRFALAWAMASWLMFELVPTKLPHYVLPIVPALALAVAGVLQDNRELPGRWQVVLWSTITVAIAAGALWASWAYAGPTAIAITFIALLLLLLYVLWSHKIHQFIAVPVAAVITSGLLLGSILPNLTALALSPRIAEAVAPHRSTAHTPVVLTRFQEPSAVFLLGTNTIITTPESAANYLSKDTNILAVVSDSQIAQLTSALQIKHSNIVLLDRVTGYNYSKGRSESLVIVRSSGLAVPE